MPVELNHTIVAASNPEESARFLADILGLQPPTTYGPFQVVSTANSVSLDFMDGGSAVTPQHYAFLVTEDEFDQILDRIHSRGLDFWAGPGRREQGEINTRDGGRGVYFEDPDSHSLEILTRPYGSGG